MQGTNMEVVASSQISVPICSIAQKALDEDSMQTHHRSVQQTTPTPGRTIGSISNIPGPIVFSDATLSPGPGGQPAIAGVGVFIQFGDDRRCSKLCISAISPSATSAIQAEAFSLMLATQIAGALHLQHATFLTDNAMLAAAVASQSMISAPGHWSIRPQLAYIAASSWFDPSRVYHVSRGCNFRAHHQAKLALKVQNVSFSFRCLGSCTDSCLNADVTALSSILQCKLVYVRCC